MEWVAVFRIRVGRAINSVALIADGYHARTDGLTSLAVVLGVLGCGWGFRRPTWLIGLVITAKGSSALSGSRRERSSRAPRWG